MYVDSDAVPSPPLSPTHGNEEASQIGSILESVCNAKDVSSAAIAKLCDHVKADPQEQQVALNVLITHFGGQTEWRPYFLLCCSW